jgi:catechol 2,3-dioxygenase-like lactoylglutathione lyase family enzyme
MDASVAFYSETLGLRLEFRAGDQWATIDAGKGFQLGLHPASERQPAPGTAGAVTIGLAVDQPIEQVVSTLRRRGVAFHLTGGYREQATARDPITTDIQRSGSRDQGYDPEL